MQVSPIHNLPYDTIYGNGRMPHPTDPGWQQRKVNATGQVYKMIRIHGPFDVAREGKTMHCHDGWLAVDANDAPFAIVDDDPDRKPATKGVTE